MAHFKGKQFKQEIIMVAVGYYPRHDLSYCVVSEILRERGIEVYRWVQEFSQIAYCPWKKRNRTAGNSWRMD